MQFTPHSDQLGIKTGGVLTIAGHSLQLLFLDLNSQTSRLETIGLLKHFQKPFQTLNQGSAEN